MNLERWGEQDDLLLGRPKCMPSSRTVHAPSAPFSVGQQNGAAHLRGVLLLNRKVKTLKQSMSPVRARLS